MKTNLNGVMMQYFEWYISPTPHLWKRVKQEAPTLAKLGISALWLPPAYKGSGGVHDIGYGVYDLYDLGEFNQKGSIVTKYGSKEEYVEAINTLHQFGIEAYVDIVLNHKMGADEAESVPATSVAFHNRNQDDGTEEIIKAWTRFSFPQRQGKYSNFTWNWTHFDGIDYDQETHRNKIFRLYRKEWDTSVSNENGNYDYLMGADIDFHNQEVLDELDTWGKWYYDSIHFDGVRLDAIKHINASFFKDWLAKLRIQDSEIFAVGEYWSGDVSALLQYLDGNDGCMHLFDVPLHMHFRDASTSNGQFDMRTLLDNTLVKIRPMHTVTFVDNHDSQPGQALSSWVLEWFKPLAYCVILLRESGYPCIFYGDYYGIAHDQILPMNTWLDTLLKLRQSHANGIQHDYFDDSNIIGWTREGLYQHDALACIMSDSAGGSKQMYVGIQYAGRCFYDALHNKLEQVFIDECGYGNFLVEGGSVSVYIEAH